MENELQNNAPSPAELRKRILGWEELAKQYPQVDIPVTQYFSHGVYVREITIPAGVIATGAIHQHACLSVVLSGKMQVITEDGPKIIEAPMVFESPAGVKRAGQAITDCRWLTIHPYGGAPLDEKEMLGLTSVPDFKTLELATDDRADYAEALASYGVDDELVRTMSESPDDYRMIPELGMWTVQPSRIEGLGVHAQVPYPSGAVIGPARIGNNRTQLGRFVNHAQHPNAQHIFHGRDDMVVQIALEDIGAGDEITNDYRRSLHMFRSIHPETTP